MVTRSGVRSFFERKPLIFLIELRIQFTYGKLLSAKFPLHSAVHFSTAVSARRPTHASVANLSSPPPPCTTHLHSRSCSFFPLRPHPPRSTQYFKLDSHSQLEPRREIVFHRRPIPPPPRSPALRFRAHSTHTRPGLKSTGVSSLQI
jgi:hypothetical protein